MSFSDEQLFLLVDKRSTDDEGGTAESEVKLHTHNISEKWVGMLHPTQALNLITLRFIVSNFPTHFLF